MREIATQLKRYMLSPFTGFALLCFFAVFPTSLYAKEHCDSLTLKQWVDVWPSLAEARPLQRALYNAYRTVPDAPEDPLLTDGRLGKRTIALFAQFCRDLGLESGRDTAQVLMASARELNSLQERWPGWRERLAAEEFLAWTQTLESGVYGGYLQLREAVPEGPVGLFLLDAFAEHQQAETSKAGVAPDRGAGLYRLTKADLALAASGSAKALQEVAGESFQTRRDLRAELGRVLDGGKDGESEIIDILLASAVTQESYALRDDFRGQFVNGVPAELVERLDALAQAGSNSREELISQADTLVNELAERYREQIADRVPPSSEDDAGSVVLPIESFGTLRRQLRADGLPEAILERLVPPLTARSPRVVRAVTVEWKQRIADQIVPRVSFALAEGVLDTPALQARLQPLPEDVAEALASLMDVRFPDSYLFRKALQLSLPGTVLQPELETRILNLAREGTSTPTSADLNLTPITWQGSSCGCSPSGFSDGGYPDELYGLFPYWLAPQESVDSTNVTRELDFSALNRVGYYGLGFDSNGKIIDELHWRERSFGPVTNPFARRDFADFIYEAHQHRTSVDVVVYNADWSSWTQGRGMARTNADERVAAQLVDSLAELVTPELERLSNRLKPVVSFGISPRRTLGDGVTLDFDFSALSTDEAQWLFDTHMGVAFFKSLDTTLNGPANDEDQDSYSINLVVPAHCLAQVSISAEVLDGCAFFQLDNLQYLLDYVDLFLVDMSERLPNSQVGEKLTLDARLEQVRRGIETLPDIEHRLVLLAKLVPLVVAGPAEADDEALSESIAYERWNFAGLASWLLPSQDSLREVTRAEFIGSGEDSFLVSIEARVCSFVCPLRWYVRMVLFVVAAIAVVYVLASLKWFELRQVYAHTGFQAAAMIMVVLLLATFWCDPYWVERQSLLTLLLAAVVLALWLLSLRRKAIAQNYP